MPAYSSTGNRVVLCAPGDSQAVWSTETPLTNAASVAVALGQLDGQDSQSASVEVVFSFGTPGTFSINVQTADTDTDAAYTDLTTAPTITTVNTGQYASVQLTELRCNFMRLFMTAQTSNSVTLTATITRMRKLLLFLALSTAAWAQANNKPSIIPLSRCTQRRMRSSTVGG